MRISTVSLTAALVLGTLLVGRPAGAAEGKTLPGARGKGPAATPKETPAVPRCYPPQGEGVSAQTLMRNLMEGRDIDLQGRIIEGNFDAEASWPPADDRRTTQRVVPGRLRLDGCRILGRLSFPRTVFVQGVSLTCTEVLGEVDFTDSDLHGGFVGENSRFLGSVRFTRVSAESDLNFKSAYLEDGLDLSGGRFHGVMLAGAEIRRDVEISRSTVLGIDATDAKIGGAMRLDDVLVLKGFRVAQTQLERGLTASSMKVYGPMDLSESRGSGAFSLSGVSVVGGLSVSLSNGTSLAMTDVTTSENLAVIDAHFGDVTLQRVTVVGSSEFGGATFSGTVSMSDCDFGRAFRATETVFEQDVELKRVRFPGEDPMQGALFARAPLLIETVLPRPPTVLSEEDTADTGTNLDDEGMDDDDQGDEKGEGEGGNGEPEPN